ncbi:MAG: MFS transporter, partial [Agathobacter sp.]|nr:MFS transporter [Agathobacter sp.]
GYVIWDAFYTIANVPYGSMLSLISADPGDRAELSTFRSVGSMAGNISTGILLPILIYDANNNLLGERVFIIALIMGMIGFVFFQFMIRKTVIRVEQEIDLSEEPVKFNVVQATIRFFQNRAAVGATLAPVTQFIAMYGGMTANTIMWQAYFKNAQISGLMQMIGYLPMFFFMPFIRKIVAKFGKKEAMVFGMIFSAVAYGALFVLPVTPDGQGIAIWVACSVIAGIGNGVGSCVSWSLMADAMDYGEWKFGVREEGTTYAMHSFFRKLAQGIGPSLGLVLAVAFGYDAALGAAQPAEVAANLKTLVILMNTIGAVCQVIAIGIVYNLDKKTLATMQTELEERRASAK